MDEKLTYPLRLRHLPAHQPDSLPRIDKNVLADILDGKLDDFSKLMIIDCRFDYEYKGGHIINAINYEVSDGPLFANLELLFANLEPGTTLIFYCEHSILRAPNVASAIRGIDRDSNIECYPSLTFPEIYILDGGLLLDDGKTGLPSSWTNLLLQGRYRSSNDGGALNPPLKHLKLAVRLVVICFHSSY
ncbi:cdc25c, putative [Talaromyces stipitatus ATCC 10500]|uniref:protein-tyrosine-phosphatase n=1 Tax=Talaromyces stipitatus (strain ATCC 10500 / CBS 375.48 / QM 6759 / NRRL 1006) TaxID=441959 RepID=B8MUF1_TALSN|nr:cdc25c, putative [Talaromyces stipitatus ATCC 10500]EED11790.1 cdc25c, putative [Talaromyces stipitatus ATCC 10500]